MRHPYKRWNPDSYKTLARRFARRGYVIVLVGAEAEEDIGRVIGRGENIINLIGKTTVDDLFGLGRAAVLPWGMTRVLCMGLHWQDVPY